MSVAESHFPAGVIENTLGPDVGRTLLRFDTPLPLSTTVNPEITNRINTQIPDSHEAEQLSSRIEQSFAPSNLKAAENVHAGAFLASGILIGWLANQHLDILPTPVRLFYSSAAGYFGGIIASRPLERVSRSIVDSIRGQSQRRHINNFLDSELGRHTH